MALPSAYIVKTLCTLLFLLKTFEPIFCCSVSCGVFWGLGTWWKWIYYGKEEEEGKKRRYLLSSRKRGLKGPLVCENSDRERECAKTLCVLTVIKHKSRYGNHVGRSPHEPPLRLARIQRSREQQEGHDAGWLEQPARKGSAL